MSFLERLLPSEGLYCVAQAFPKGGFKHYFCETIDEAEKTIDVLDKQGQTVFLAQATFKTPDSRKQTNVEFLRNFFLDIDCGPGKDYPDQKEAVEALKAFVLETKLPFPAVVVSGNGLYAHWLLEEMLPEQQWKTIAYILRSVTEAYGFKVDPSRTCDSASVLRPVGATHRKDPNNPKAVRLVKDSDPISFNEFTRLLKKAADARSIVTTPLKDPKPLTDINADFYAGLETTSIPSSGRQVAEKCLQIRKIRDARGDVSEPFWYAGLGILVFCEEGSDLCHEWSEGHEAYSETETDKKIEQRLAAAGPSTCAHLASVNPTGCTGCKFSGKIKSPIVLGRPEPKALEVVKDDDIPPEGYRRSEKGLFYNQDERWVQFYDLDLYPIRLAFDESLGYETVTVKHFLPHEGWLEFTMRSSLVHDPKQMMIVMSDAHIKVVGNKEKNAMVAYIESYMQKLQRLRKMSALYCQMGWKERQGQTLFVLGSKVFHPNREPDEASFARNVPTAAQGYTAAGDLETWTKKTELFRAAHMEPYAFTLLAGGFGAPLMKFTGYDGAMISLVGDSGVGKTLMLRMIQSVWGYHNDLMMLRDDTKNALVSRLGVYGNLPLTIDEVTNIDGQDLSDLVYRITQGRDKARLTKNSEEKKTLNTWNTLAVVTTNSSLQEKLTGVKHDAGAELNRVFEYYVPAHPIFQGAVTTDLYWTIDNNFGLAGAVYAQWLVDNADKIRPGLDRIRAMIGEKADVRNEERYWSAIASTAIYGGLVAQSLGLVRFEVAPLVDWAVACIRAMRGEKAEMTGSSIDILGQFIDEYAAHRLIVRHDSKNYAVIDAPRGALALRQEIDTQRLYIARQTFKMWLARRFGSYNRVKNDLLEDKILRNANLRMTLGKGTQFGGSQQPCWEIDLKNPKLGNVALQLVQDAEMLARAPKEVRK